MNFQSIRAACGLTITGSIVLALATTAYAQSDSIPVTGGRAIFNNTQIFVPVPNNIDPRSVVFTGRTPDSIFIRTSQGNIPLNAIFQATTLPILDTTADGIPSIGDRGGVFGNLTFRGFTAAGEPGLFTNIPTELNFQINSGNFSAVAQPFTQYQTPPTTFTQVGTISTPTSFTVVTRTIPVVTVQFQPGTNPPQSLPTFPASLFNTDIPGNSYDASFNAQITDGSVSLPTPPGFNPTGTPTGNQNNSTVGFNNPNTAPTVFIDRSINININISNSTGITQFSPVLPVVFFPGSFTFINVRSGWWCDPPIAEGFEYEMIPRDMPIGLTSRVFPGMTGQDTASDAIFTKISGFPEAVDQDDRFTVAVEGKVLGEFGPGETLDFGDYQEELGDLLVNGEGVKKFTISAIDPGVDAADPEAFPLRLEFNTPTASFEMRAIETQQAAIAEDATEPVAIFPEEAEILLENSSN
ncbi:MAG: hypothetical protein F6K14_33060 [Symploca sp. SIO2C1]|nr:hypothetical protein [Symploca sp. SIO2C1]